MYVVKDSFLQSMFLYYTRKCLHELHIEIFFVNKFYLKIKEEGDFIKLLYLTWVRCSCNFNLIITFLQIKVIILISHKSDYTWLSPLSLCCLYEIITCSFSISLRVKKTRTFLSEKIILRIIRAEINVCLTPISKHFFKVWIVVWLYIKCEIKSWP